MKMKIKLNMDRISLLKQISSLFSFKSLYDECGNEYIVFSNSNVEVIQNVEDHTAFEALENHVHLLDDISKREFDNLEHAANGLGTGLLHSLNYSYPEKHFFVYVTYRLHDSLIIRFHQKWGNESPYYDVNNFKAENEKVFIFESGNEANGSLSKSPS